MKKIILIILFTFIISCSPNNGTSTGNPFISLSITSSGNASTVVRSIFHKIFSCFVNQSMAMAPPPLMKDANNNDVVVSDFWMSLGEIEFKPSETAPSDEIDGIEVAFTGPYIINMLAATPQNVVSGNLVNSDFRRVKYKLVKVNNPVQGAPNGLSGNTIYISGTVNGQQFTFSTTAEIEMSVAGANLVGAQSGDFLLLQVKLANLIKKIDLTAITSSTSINEGNRLSAHCPLIDSSATDAYSCIMTGLSTEANMGRDLNGDGEFEASENTVK
ncbi:MAG: hypothetical protein ACXWRE_08015 [Pseudobdellovibrionaceae bacterium]